MNKAVFIKDLPEYRGNAKLYKLTPPLIEKDYASLIETEHEFVIVSAVSSLFSGEETFIFPSTEDGEVSHFSELRGSYRGGLSHAGALKRAGYEIV